MAEIPEALKEENPEIFGVNNPAKSLETPLPRARAGIKSKNGGMLLEKDLQGIVVDFLHSQGYKILVTGIARIKRGGKDVYLTPYRADGVGFSDVLAFNPDAKYKIIALELKSGKGKASPEQVDWLLIMSKCGVLTGIVTPATWETMKVKIKEV
jgi:hypothetical protein